ncbi:MAG: Glu/Leu/Phe/Val dehydrogenase [Gemmatimonadetes bacterium]|nr:leucine dehydrogenase [Gemmatimonadota bacterium]NNM04828.1 Glu/Leu/Phe/Val dehydrogenase [Gemmatimonadota bacterium]
MEIFDRMCQRDHEQLVFWNEPRIGYKGIIAIHNTTLGPALGGTRFWNYATDDEAIEDSLRLARGMTYKSALAGLNLGGGKSVIIGDPNTRDREMIFRAHGRAVESLAGRYITAEDVGTSPADMDFVHMETDHVVGLMGKSGDPSPVTAYGVYQGMKAAALHKYGDDSLAGKHVTVQGCGHVGYFLCQDLAEEGARLTVTDIDQEKVDVVVKEFDAKSVGPDAIYAVEADVFAPCALGAILNDDTLKVLAVDIVVGGANNQLAETRHAQEVEDKGILYGPDYLVNAGGLINVYAEIQGWPAERSLRKAGEIYNTLLRILELAESEGITTAKASDRVAEQRMEEVGYLHRTELGSLEF